MTKCWEKEPSLRYITTSFPQLAILCQTVVPMNVHTCIEAGDAGMAELGKRASHQYGTYIMYLLELILHALVLYKHRRM